MRTGAPALTSESSRSQPTRMLGYSTMETRKRQTDVCYKDKEEGQDQGNIRHTFNCHTATKSSPHYHSFRHGDASLEEGESKDFGRYTFE